ncbi:phytoene synthase [Mycolicibacterium sp. BK556]|uniref:phytoene/squalene synthase family protein n=1 Tax=unclassified Mycolicibacterium TaxID=2636767 RepID=UPI0016188A23|nr:MULTISPECIES: phytoene/squalene synthase family protein [unclassified Mycolicibacterium]MBB3602329.1 phytoene synthase [Mycolicibacterium sp. BK556]MBB3632081.1 phytoene synthase [Mycolicibacterium sp. BK607]
MIHTELAAAGINDPTLRDAYRRCRRIAARNGRTYFLATRLLAPDQRPAVHALYAFARYADDILDEFNPELDARARGERLQRLSDQFFGNEDRCDEPVLVAVDHTVARYRIPGDLFKDFLSSMRMDLNVTDYPNRAALNHYMRGSAEVIGLQMLPVLGTVNDPHEAEPYAEALGQAFQLTNFLRDVDEDLVRNRVYLPADELAADGVDRELLAWCHDNRRTDPRVRRALAAQHDITRTIYRFAAQGIAALTPRSRPCVATAFTLYQEILDRIEESDFAVFSHRATVSKARRLQVAGGALVESWRARRADSGARSRYQEPGAS